MPIRLVLFLLAILSGFLYLTFLNTVPAPINLYPGVTLYIPLSIPLLASFSAGVVTVMLLYFYDTFAEAFHSAKKGALRKRAMRLAQLYESGIERLMLEKKSEAEKYFKKALSHDQSHIPSIIALGKLRREEGKVSEAIKLHSKARGIDGSSVAALMELAEDYTASEQFLNAVAVLQEAQTVAGRSMPLLIRMRDIFLKVRNLKEAISAQKQVVSIAPYARASEERRMLVALIYEDALENLAQGLFYEARDRFKSVLRSDNQFTPAYLKLAEVYERVGSPKEAIKILEKGFKATHSLITLKAMEIFLEARDETDIVVEKYRWAKSILPDEKVIGLLLAEAYLKNSDLASARDEIDSLNGSLGQITLYHLVEGKIRQGEHNIDLALGSLSMAHQLETASFFRFSCSACKSMSLEFSGRCKACGEWNTLQPAFLQDRLT